MQDLIAKIEAFVTERNWERYHAPKNLAMALSVEAAEIVEIFQWMDETQSRDPDHATRDHLRDEIGDVLIYLAMLAHKLDIDPLAAAHAKLVKNRLKYPTDGAAPVPSAAAKQSLKD
jgi:NTP pyrophosphatase (non-canonical NTP hydrolase)